MHFRLIEYTKIVKGFNNSSCQWPILYSLNKSYSVNLKDTGFKIKILSNKICKPKGD